VFGRETSSIENIILLVIHPYKERSKQSLYMILMMILVRTVLKFESAFTNHVRLDLFVFLYHK
jgi:hypothetical protein